ncbi:BT4734/BF3469 family protein [Bergeyella zoohelcum]|uniref:VirE N-terminal domain n=1 Tax=Bergeyella zoohelcum TaxID=1015 RepID=A0A7Z8YP37_9FLAO|nr:BT4734/BF3469 family protein [Bergeyella zoohelcum]VDH02918.1 VirE N-terminal domain [Bergeyella zoohelcum]
MNNYKIDIWHDYNAKSPETISLSDIFECIKNEEFKNHIEEIRTFLKEGNKKDANKSKNKLPGFTVSGIFFTKRRKGNIKKYYGLMALDIDNLKDEEEVKRIKERICKIKYTKMAFISPSGLGIKIVVETDNTDVEKHKEVYEELLNYYKQELDIEFDEKTIDVARLCFISSDGEAYLNLDSEIFVSKNANIKEKVANEETICNDDKFDRIIEKIVEFSKNKQKFEKGNRNRFVYLLVKNNKLVAITKEKILEYCLNNYVEEDFPEDEIIDIVRSVYNNDKIIFGEYAYIY